MTKHIDNLVYCEFIFESDSLFYSVNDFHLIGSITHQEYQKICAMKKLSGMVVRKRFYEVGSHKGMRELSQYLRKKR